MSMNHFPRREHAVSKPTASRFQFGLNDMLLVVFCACISLCLWMPLLSPYYMGRYGWHVAHPGKALWFGLAIVGISGGSAFCGLWLAHKMERGCFGRAFTVYGC